MAANSSSDAPDRTGPNDEAGPVALRCSALLVRDENVLLLHREGDRNDWVLPGGNPLPEEPMGSCVRREVLEETALHVSVGGVAFVLETANLAVGHARLIDLVFDVSDDDSNAEPQQREDGLVPVWQSLDELHRLELRPPLAGHIRGLHGHRQLGRSARLPTAAYLGNVWRPAGRD